jgi:beta-glucosidase
VLYGEELFMGYRGFEARGIEPTFPFGHGLGYTTFGWGEPSLSAPTIDRDALGGDTTGGGGALTVTVPVTNTGTRPGSEVVQCYVGDPGSTLRRPRQELKGFTKVELAPGETTDVVLELGFRSFAAWNPSERAWVVEPGRFEVRVSRSSADVHAVLPLEITAPDPAPGT